MFNTGSASLLKILEIHFKVELRGCEVLFLLISKIIEVFIGGFKISLIRLVLSIVFKLYFE